MMHCLVNTQYAENLFCTISGSDPAMQTITFHRFWRAKILARKHFGALFIRPPSLAQPIYCKLSQPLDF